MKEKTLNWFYRNSTIVLLVVPLLIIALIADNIGDNLIERVITVLFINLVIVLGLQLFMGNSGILAWTHVGFMGIGAYASVLCSMTPEAKALTLPNLYPVIAQIHLPFLVSILIGAVVAAFAATLISYPLMRLSDAAAVITFFATLIVIHVVLIRWDVVTNGPRTLFGVERYTYLWTSAIFGIITVIAALWFKESALGLKLRASRDDRYAAASIGINIVRVRWYAFIVSAFIAGLGGGLWAHFITSFSPSAFYLSETFTLLAMLVVGGASSVSGAVVGTVVVTLAREVLRGIENTATFTQVLPVDLLGFTEVFLAIALIVVLALRPSGLLGSREITWKRKRKVIPNGNGFETESNPEV
jgi:branched-chain amino acid transport system permease protein